jgi:hypothetical protein
MAMPYYNHFPFPLSLFLLLPLGLLLVLPLFFPPSVSAVASRFTLGPALVPFSPVSAIAFGFTLGPALIPLPPVSAIAFGSALSPAFVSPPAIYGELAARYAALSPLQPQRNYNVQNPVCINYNLLIDIFSHYN